MLKLSQIPLPSRGLWGRTKTRIVLGSVVGALAAAGLTLIVAGLGAAHHAPDPPAAVADAPLGPHLANPSSTPSTTAHAPQTPSPTSHGREPGPLGPSLAPASGAISLPVSPPVSLDIPAIHARSALLDLGLNTDGTVQVPPLARESQAGWYQYSATPGAIGSAVILGHIDSAAYGAGIFYDLGLLRPGDEVDVTRTDRVTAVFRIDRVAEYLKTAFPSAAIYGATPYASLKLVTCGGSFDARSGSYRDNIVAFATLVGTRSA